MATANDIFAGQVPNFDTEFPPWLHAMVEAPSHCTSSEFSPDYQPVVCKITQGFHLQLLNENRKTSSILKRQSKAWHRGHPIAGEWMFMPSFGDNLW